MARTINPDLYDENGIPLSRLKWWRARSANKQTSLYLSSDTLALVGMAGAKLRLTSTTEIIRAALIKVVAEG